MEGGSGKVFGHRGHRWAVKMDSEKIFGKSGNYFEGDLVYTSKTTRGVGG